MGPRLTIQPYVWRKGCAMDSLNGLDKLLEAEAKAAALIKDAEAEAGAIISEASETVHATEKEALAKLGTEQAAALADFARETSAKLEKALADYKNELKSLPRDEKAFERACRTLMAAGA